MKLSRRRSAFTLLEIMLVVTIIALLLTAALVSFRGQLGYGQETRVASDLQTFSTNLNLYRAMNGFYPSTAQGLSALVTRPDGEPAPTQWRKLIEKLPKDPYQSDYIYAEPGVHNPDTFDVFSAGSDRKPGTDDDIGNWERGK